MEQGTVYFFTGLAGAGKTTIGSLFYERLKEVSPRAVLYDGDRGRTSERKAAIAAGRTDPDDEEFYSTESRKRGALRRAAVCKADAEAGRDVVLCSISMYKEVRAWYRHNVQHYREIYLKVSWDTLRSRNQKGLYSPGRKNVVGVDLPWDEPDSPDVVIENDGAETPEQIVDRLVRKFLSGGTAGEERRG